jgi:hypothetical protein
MADLYDDEEDVSEGIDYNFTHRAQEAFDQLHNDTDWTWSGLANAYAKRYTKEDIEELVYYLIYFLDAARGELDE